MSAYKTTAEKMKAYREWHGYSVKDMSYRCGVSETLLKMVEAGMVTHPKLAEQIAGAYGLSEMDILEIIPENYRPGPKYNPGKYKVDPPKYKDQLFVKTRKNDKDYYGYLKQNSNAIKENGRRGVIK